MYTQRVATVMAQATSSITSGGDTSQHTQHAVNIQAMFYYFPHSTVQRGVT